EADCGQRLAVDVEGQGALVNFRAPRPEQAPERVVTDEASQARLRRDDLTPPLGIAVHGGHAPVVDYPRIGQPWSGTDGGVQEGPEVGVVAQDLSRALGGGA